MGCSSLYLQVGKSESVAAFRRDATNAKLLHIVKYKINGKAAIKQYKTNSYFFHLVTTADGWMFGTGGVDNPTVNHAIEKLAGKIIKAGKIKKSHLRKIQSYERRLSLGHFSIKAPNGEYGLVWSGSIIKGKLKAGEFIDVPNVRSSFRHGNWAKFSKNPATAAINRATTGLTPASTSMTVTAPPVVKEPSTVRSLVPSSRNVMYTPSAMNPQIMPCAIPPGSAPSRFPKFKLIIR